MFFAVVASKFLPTDLTPCTVLLAKLIVIQRVTTFWLWRNPKAQEPITEPWRGPLERSFPRHILFSQELSSSGFPASSFCEFYRIFQTRPTNVSVICVVPSEVLQTGARSSRLVVVLCVTHSHASVMSLCDEELPDVIKHPPFICCQRLVQLNFCFLFHYLWLLTGR
jgi:hypothetical protein